MPVNNYPPGIERDVADLLRRVAALETAPALDSAVISPDGKLVIHGDLEVDGDTTLDGSLSLVGGAVLTASGDIMSVNYVVGVSGWKLDGMTGDLEVNDITLRGGIIGDDALAHPSAFAQNKDINPACALNGSFATVASTTLTVPSGFTQALLIANGLLGTFNSTGDTLLQTRMMIDGVDEGFYPLGSCHNGDATTIEFPVQTVLTGISGTITLDFAALAQPTNLPSTASAALLYATAIFLR